MKKIIALTALLACTTAHADDLSQYAAEARAVAMPFLKQLGEINKKAVSEAGPESAIQVCKDVAPKMTSDISRQTGWKMTRVSLKVRNPLLGTTDAWEQKQLLSFADRASKGEKPEVLEVSEIVQEPAGKSFRFIKAITVQPGCLSCHGEQLPDDVKAKLSADYPHDKAIGYSAGQIRGAVSIKRSL